jgi:hypothetical protein
MVKPHERVRITIHDLLTEAEVDQVIVRAQGLDVPPEIDGTPELE